TTRPCRPTEQVCRRARDRQGQVAARWPSATLDGRCPQRRTKFRSGRGDVAGQPNKEMPDHNRLDTNRPVQVPGRTFDGVDGAPNGIKRAKMVVVESAIWKGGRPWASL